MLQRFLKGIAASHLFYVLILLSIFVSCFTVAVRTLHLNGDINNELFYLFDLAVTIVFTMEVIIKIGAQGRHPELYFKDGWNVFDFLITLICIISVLSPDSVFDILCILRITRFFSTVPKLRLWVSTLLRSLPSIAYVFLFLTILFFVYGAIGVFAFSENDPFHFGSLPHSLLSLFRIITLEDWTDIMYQNIFGYAYYPEQVYSFGNEDLHPVSRAHTVGASIYFITFVLINVFLILNMFTGIVLSTIQEIKVELEEETHKKYIETVIGDKEEVKNTLPKVSPGRLDAITEQLSDIQDTIIALKAELESNNK
ncbi:MAG: ion transporter [Prevotella sp.]|jgi:voltage-gated sodium channel|nr:ion transporter [Prevotella sp.]